MSTSSPKIYPSLQSASQNLDVVVTQSPHSESPPSNFSEDSANDGEPSIKDCTEIAHHDDESPPPVSVHAQVKPCVAIEEMSEEAFMNFTLAQIRAGKLDLFVSIENDLEEEAIGEHFLRYPFLY